MSTRRIYALAVTVLVAACAGLMTSHSASASTPVTTGCPAAFEVLSLEFLAGQGPYQLPFRLDAAGNDDGLVCGKQAPNVVTEHVCGASCPLPALYTFLENDITARS